MKKFFALSAAALAIFATACNKELAPETEISGNKVKMTLTVNAPAETRTALDDEGVNVLWQEGDAITVFGSETSNSNGYKFTIKSGVGSATATFEGEIAEDDISEVFYAVYPAVAVRPASLESGKIELDKSLGEVQTAVKDGYDPDYAVLAGIVSADNKVTFLHGMAYFKLTVGTEGVYSINLKTSNTRFGGRPVFEVSSDEGFVIKPSAIESAKDNITLKPASGTFEKGATYYIPVPVKNSTLKVLTVSYAFDEEGTAVESISTDAKSNEYLELGKVYNLGTPPIEQNPSPTLNVQVTVVENIDPDAAEGLVIKNAYTVRNCTDEDILVSYDGVVVTSASVSDGAVTYAVSANDSETMREGWIKLALDGSDEYTIVVTQRADGLVYNYTWNFSDDEWQAALAAAAPGAKGENISGWTVTLDGLTYTSGSSNGKWDSDSDGYFIQPNGGGSKTARVFSFNAPIDGILRITAKSASSGNAREVNVEDAAGKQTQTVDAQAVLEYEVAAGDVYVYPGGGIRFYKFEYVSGSTGGNDGGDDPGTEPGKPHTYIFYMNEKTIVQTIDGTVGANYFTIGGTSALQCSETGYFGVDGFEILGQYYNYAKKLDSSNTFSFTTSPDLKSSVRFFAGRRDDDDKDTKIRLRANGKSTYEGSFEYTVITDSGLIELEPGTAYTIDKQNGEVGLFYVEVVESL